LPGDGAVGFIDLLDHPVICPNHHPLCMAVRPGLQKTNRIQSDSFCLGNGKNSHVPMGLWAWLRAVAPIFVD
jgi:hypothetical protein